MFDRSQSTCGFFSAATAKAETMLAIAEFVGVDLDMLWIVARKLQAHEAMLDAAVGSSKRNELERLMSEDIDELAHAYKIMERAVERGAAV
jgi:hypothetical protein